MSAICPSAGSFGANVSWDSINNASGAQKCLRLCDSLLAQMLSTINYYGVHEGPLVSVLHCKS